MTENILTDEDFRPNQDIYNNLPVEAPSNEKFIAHVPVIRSRRSAKALDAEPQPTNMSPDAADIAGEGVIAPEERSNVDEGIQALLTNESLSTNE